METSIKQYSMSEEIANSITHGIGMVLAIAALGILTAFAGVYGDVWHVVSVSIYGTTLVLLYTASTLYHSIQNPHAKSILQVLDHAAIYLLIAGTYTPFTLVSLRGPWGWWLFGVIWGLAVLGVVLQLSFMRRWRAVSLALYIGMGWVVVVAIKPLIVSVATGGIVFLVSGRAGLHDRHSVLWLEKNEISPCHLAPVCAGRKHPSFLCRFVLRRTDSGTSINVIS